MITITITPTTTGGGYNGYNIACTGTPDTVGEGYIIKADFPLPTPIVTNTIANYLSVLGDTAVSVAHALYLSLDPAYQNGEASGNFDILINGNGVVATVSPFTNVMALKSSPAKLATVHNPIIFVIDSGNKTEVNYKYFCDVYINSIRIARLKNNPNPNFSNYGIFDVSKILQSYISSDYFTAAPVLAYINPYIIFMVKFSERYEAAGSEIQNNDQVIADDKYAYNAALSYLESPIFNENIGGNINLLQRKFITTRPSPISVPSLRDFYITGYTSFPDISIISFALRLTTYTGLNQTGTPSETTYPATISKDNDFIVNIGTKGLVNAGVSITGINSYKLDLIIDGVALVDTILFNIDLCEPKHEILHFVFLNRFGGYESVYFTKASRKRIEVDRRVMQSLGTVFNSTTFTVNNKDSNNTFYEAHKVYGVKYIDKLKVSSNWLTDADYVWLKDLINSPVIYFEDTIPAAIGVTETIAYIPVRLTNKEYEVKKKINEKLTLLELEFEVGFNNYTQIR